MRRGVVKGGAPGPKARGDGEDDLASSPRLAGGYSAAGRRRWVSSAMITAATRRATTTAKSQEASSMSWAAAGAWNEASRKPTHARRR